MRYEYVEDGSRHIISFPVARTEVMQVEGGCICILYDSCRMAHIFYAAVPAYEAESRLKLMEDGQPDREGLFRFHTAVKTGAMFRSYQDLNRETIRWIEDRIKEEAARNGM